MYSIEPNELPIVDVHKLLLSGVAPRPIALVSTIAEDGTKNLAPFSFFNAFGANPPVVAFSPARRGRDASLKDTYNNLMNSKECVIQAVTHSMLHQINLASCEYDSSVDEFERAGFTEQESDIVKPFRVAESPFQMECKLHKMVSVGEEGGSGNLAICEVVKFHVADELMTDTKIFDPNMIDLVGRNGGNYYTRASGQAVFPVDKPGAVLGIGFNGLPDFMKLSKVYTGNDLARFALVDKLPSRKTAELFISTIEVGEPSLNSFERFSRMKDYKKMLGVALVLVFAEYAQADVFLEETAKVALDFDKDFAWNVALYKGIVFDGFK
jgi:flavin reductase (DIM6/NTAB) family NADH-FMN oxidoreductase RutF